MMGIDNTTIGNNFSRGSEWRKWDLHFHTPSSFDYANKSITDDDIINILYENNISVVCITDHNFIDTQRIRKLQNLGKDKIVVFPGIEFCSELGGSEAVHFIGIFPEKSDIESIWTKLQGKLNLTPDDITNRGGHERIQSDLMDTCDIIHELGGLTSIHAGTKSDTIENIKNTLLVKMEQKRRILSEFIDILELGKPDDIIAYETIVFKSINFRLPMILCSDNHNLNNYSLKCNCWIKADTTFEGLKQITYEPEGRVSIQEANPNLKKLYNIIEKVKFIDSSGNNKFTDIEIGFNPYLNAIIGGKSSGKSLLLHSIAKTIGFKSNNKDYEKILEKIDLDVYYADDPEKKRTTEDRRIIEFLPQLHIERIVREKSENTTDSQNYFDDFIEELICQEEEIKELYEVHSNRVGDFNEKLESDIKLWVSLDKELSHSKEELKPLGDKRAIQKEIDKILNSIENLKLKAGLSDSESQLYNSLIKSNEECCLKIEQLKKHKSEITNLRNYLANCINDSISSFLHFDTQDNYTKNLFYNLRSDIEILITKEINMFFEMLEKKEHKIANITSLLNTKIEKNNTQLFPIMAKNKINDEIELHNNNVKIEKLKIESIIQKENEIAEIEKKRNEILFIDNYKIVLESYNELAQSINKSIGEKWIAGNANLTLTASPIFETSKFIDSIGSVINMQSYLEKQFPNCGFSASDYLYDNSHINNIKNILFNVLNDENRFSNFKKSGNTEALMRAVLKDCNYIDFDIIKSGDSLQNMSEGKKGIVVLQLYLSLSKSDCPILIDQPEDNLDNRTVYVELNDYIKQCKQRRQIIMVSHNANLVVNTDAENVIVANQAGEDGKDNKEFKFEYINGALENSFYDSKQKGILYQKGIKEHVCEILEGGIDAFKKREEKYNLK